MGSERAREARDRGKASLKIKHPIRGLTGQSRRCFTRPAGGVSLHCVRAHSVPVKERAAQAAGTERRSRATVSDGNAPTLSQ